MPNLIPKLFIHLLTNVKYGIIKRLILIKLEEQWNNWDMSFKNLDANEIVFLFNPKVAAVVNS